MKPWKCFSTETCRNLGRNCLQNCKKHVHSIQWTCGGFGSRLLWKSLKFLKSPVYDVWKGFLCSCRSLHFFKKFYIMSDQEFSPSSSIEPAEKNSNDSKRVDILPIKISNANDSSGWNFENTVPPMVTVNERPPRFCLRTAIPDPLCWSCCGGCIPFHRKFHRDSLLP